MAGTLGFVSLILLLAMAVASYSISHLAVSNRLVNGRQALNLADSAASRAIGHIMTDPNWAGDVEYLSDAAPGGRGTVTFSATTAASWSCPLSVNNFNSPNSVPGFQGRTLPPHTLQVVAMGRYNGVTRVTEQLINLPPYGYALVTSGKVHSTGSLLVAGVEDPALLANGVSHLTPDQLKSGYVASNDGADAAVRLESTAAHPTRVQGGVEAVGGIDIGDHTDVQGVVREHTRPAPIPSFTLSDYDPKDRSDLIPVEDPEATHLRVDGATRRQGDLTVNDGLDIHSGYLYVQGNLIVHGGLSGRGALFVTGNVSIDGVSTFGADNQEAILAGGDLHVAGQSQDQSIFQGILYTQGAFSAEDVTLVGAVLARSSGGSGGGGGGGSVPGAELANVNLIHNDQILELDWSSGFDPQPQLSGDSGVLFRTSAAGAAASPTVALRNTPRDFYDASNDKFTLNASPVKLSFVLPAYSDSGNGQVYKYDTLADARAVLANPARAESLRAYATMTPPTTTYTTEMVHNPDGSMTMVRVPHPAGGIQPVGDVGDPSFLQLYETQAATESSLIENAFAPSLVDNFNSLYQRTRAPWMRQDSWGFNFNPNRFLQTNDKVRRLLYREVPSQG